MSRSIKVSHKSSEIFTVILPIFKASMNLAHIKCLVADREFVGHEWFQWLNDNAVQYHIRIRDNFRVEDPRTGEKIRSRHIFNNLKHGEERVLHRIYRVCGELCYLSGATIKDKAGKPEPQILVSFCNPEEALPSYKERWTIETMFKGLNFIADTLFSPFRPTKINVFEFLSCT